MCLLSTGSRVRVPPGSPEFNGSAPFEPNRPVRTTLPRGNAGRTRDRRVGFDSLSSSIVLISASDERIAHRKCRRSDARGGELRIENADLRKRIHELSRESDSGRVGRAWPSLDTSRVNRVAGAQNRDRYTEKENTYDR